MIGWSLAFGVVVGAYVLLTLWFLLGWLRLPKKSQVGAAGANDVSLSVIVPFRNEALRLPALIADLKRQSYAGDWEVIFVNDHSEDEEGGLLSEVPSWLVLSLSKGQTGKKAALTEGIRRAKGEFIVTLDADVSLDPNYLTSVAASLSGRKADMMLMPVLFAPKPGLFSKLQDLEFLSLLASTAGATGWQQPFMANGASLAYRKSAFEAVNGFEGTDQMASGDDVFLLHKLQAAGNYKIIYGTAKEMWVNTPAPSDLSSFLQQRARWAGKAKHYRNGVATMSAWTVLLCNLLIVAGALSLPWQPAVLCPLLLSITAKWVIDFLLLFLVASYFGRTGRLWYFVLMECIYPAYLLAVIGKVLTGKIIWKGRVID